MITLNVNQGKRLKFTYAVANIDPTNISGKFVIEFDSSNVSFPIRVSDNQIIVEIKANNKFLKQASGIIKARLEIIADRDTFITPWNGEIKIEKRKPTKTVLIPKNDIPVVKRPKEVKKAFLSPLEEKMRIIREKLDKRDGKKPLLEESDDINYLYRRRIERKERGKGNAFGNIGYTNR